MRVGEPTRDEKTFIKLNLHWEIIWKKENCPMKPTIIAGAWRMKNNTTLVMVYPNQHLSKSIAHRTFKIPEQQKEDIHVWHEVLEFLTANGAELLIGYDGTYERYEKVPRILLAWLSLCSFPSPASYATAKW